MSSGCIFTAFDIALLSLTSTDECKHLVDGKFRLSLEIGRNGTPTHVSMMIDRKNIKMYFDPGGH